VNGVKEEYHVKLEQTSKGVWYCSGLDVFVENHVDLASEADLCMSAIESVLSKHNEAISPPGAPVVLDVGFVPLKGPKGAKK